MDNASRKPKTALVTGASAGIGAAVAEELARLGCDLVLVARRAERLEDIARRVGEAHGRRSLVIRQDLADPAGPERIFNTAAAAGLEVDFLVNNAGFAIKGSFLKADWSRQADQLQLMSTSVVHLCHLFVPGMLARGHGWVLNVASIGAWWPHVPGSLYNPIKLFVVEFTQALRAEVGPAGVNCCALCPGLTRTEFHEKMGIQAQVDRLPEFIWMQAAEVARQGVADTLAGQSLSVPGRFNRVSTALMKHVPTRLKNRMGGHRKHSD